MSRKQTIRALLAGTAAPPEDDDRQDERVLARMAWVGKTTTAHRRVQKKVCDAWARIFEQYPDDLDEEELNAIPEPPEQAELNAIEAQISDVLQHDRWPKELYWGGI